MTKKDKNKYGLHPIQVNIKKNKDGSSTFADAQYQAGPCVFPYKKKGDTKKYYQCFDEPKLGKKVCPVTVDKKTKLVETVGICYDINKLDCEISPEHLPKKRKKKKEHSKKKHQKKQSNKKTKSVSSSSNSANNKKFCRGMNNWCTGGKPTMINPPKNPPDMDNKYEFLRQQTGYAAFYTNPDGNCLFHSIAGSIILDPQLGSDFLLDRLKFFEATYLTEGETLKGENFGEILRNAYIKLLTYYPYETKFYMIYNLIIADDDDLKNIIPKTFKKIKNENIKDYRDKQIAAGELPQNLVELENKDSYLEKIAIHTMEVKNYDLGEAETAIINYMVEKFINKMKNHKVYAFDIMGRELCNALSINLIRHDIYPGKGGAKWAYSFQQEEFMPIRYEDMEIVNVNIFYNGINHYEYMVNLNNLPPGYEGTTLGTKKKRKDKNAKKSKKAHSN